MFKATIKPVNDTAKVICKTTGNGEVFLIIKEDIGDFGFTLLTPIEARALAAALVESARQINGL